MGRPVLRPLVAVAAIIAGASLVHAAEKEDAGLTARAIVEDVYKASGGDTWRRPETLYMAGHAIFYPDGTQSGRVVADDYRMWRRYAPDSEDAHLANGMVRIDSRVGEAIMFQIAFDGETAYNADGPVDGGAANPQWRSSFGFGIIRYALGDGFALERLPDDPVDGHPCYVIRVTDPAGSTTIFGIDKSDYAVRMVGFDTPKGWHQRYYSDFVTQASPPWRQPRHVRLHYDGVKQNEVFWQTFKVNEAIADRVFVLPSDD